MLAILKYWLLQFQAGTIGATEFHQILQDVTNFPLKPFVLPFLKLNIPLLTREVAANAANADQTTVQYLRSHHNFLADTVKGIFSSTNRTWYLTSQSDLHLIIPSNLTRSIL